MGKKGYTLFSVGVFLMFVIFSMLFLADIIGRANELKGNAPLGARQALLLDTYISAEKSILFAEHAALFATDDAIVQLASNAGTFVQPVYDEGDTAVAYVGGSCGFHEDKVLLNDVLEGTCFPSPKSAQAHLAGYFNEELDRYIVKEPARNLPLNNYDLEIIGSVATANARRKLVITEGEAVRSRVSGLPWPMEGPLTDGFGIVPDPFNPSQNRWHGGIDIAAISGTKVVAVDDGVVVYVGDDGGFGGTVRIDHGNGLFTSYSHLREFKVDVGDPVSTGDWIGNSGGSIDDPERGTVADPMHGSSTGAHLHFDFRDNLAYQAQPGQMELDPFCFLSPISEDGHQLNYEPQCDGVKPLEEGTQLQVQGITDFIQYTIYPSFEFDFEHDLSVYDDVTLLAQDIIDTCRLHISIVSCAYPENARGFSSISVQVGSVDDRIVVVSAERNGLNFNFALQIPRRSFTFPGDDRYFIYSGITRTDISTFPVNNALYIVDEFEQYAVIITEENRQEVQDQIWLGATAVILNVGNPPNMEPKPPAPVVGRLIPSSPGVQPQLPQIQGELDCTDILAPVNRQYGFSSDCEPDDLRKIDSKYALSNRGHWVREAVLPHLVDLLDAGRAAGHPIGLVSTNRTYEYQARLRTYQSGDSTADAGHSEHQMGTAVDIATLQTASLVVTGKEPEFVWLAENAVDHGFVLSYPKGNGIYIYEPWHFRWVGIPVAAEINRQIEDDQNNINKPDDYFRAEWQ